MDINIPFDIASFFVAGINYKKADAGIRGCFSIDNDKYNLALNNSRSFGINSLFILSTCNRTEIYGFAENADQLIGLLCSQTIGCSDLFHQLGYVKKGGNAVEHLFNVGSGLDSQLLGDYEIVGQLKQAIKFSKDRGGINCFLERLTNNVLQCSKTIKTETTLSNGTVSASFTAVQYIKNHIGYKTDKKILVIGIGKIGRNTCKNLVDYLGATDVTLINRSVGKAAELAAELNLKYAVADELDEYVASSDIILVATNANEPVIRTVQLKNAGNKLIIDLSVPHNVEASAQHFAHIKLINVDELSKQKDNTLLKRETEVPKAKAIIVRHIAEFMEWHQARRNAPVLSAIKNKLTEIYTIQQLNNAPSDRTTANSCIQKVINNVAGKMRSEKQNGCLYINAINEFIAISA
ncbi:MAG: glutamyl-tRNA reductase [Mucilaginibacter sp.]